MEATRRYNAYTLIVAASLLLCPLAGCDDIIYDAPGGIVIYDAGIGGGPDGGIKKNWPVMEGEITPVYGFVSAAARTEYYYLGEVQKVNNKVPINEMYFFYDQNDKPLFRMAEDGSKLVGWHPIVRVVPTKPGYSPFWRVVKVKVNGAADPQAINALRVLPAKKDICQMDSNCPAGTKCIEERCTTPIQIGEYALNGIKSFESLEESKLTTTQTQALINCPVMDADAKLLKGISNADRPFAKIQVWYKRLKAFCYLAEGGKEKEIFGDWASHYCSTKELSAGCDNELKTKTTYATLSGSCKGELSDAAKAARACEQALLCTGPNPAICKEKAWLSSSVQTKRKLERAMLQASVLGLSQGKLPAAPLDAYFVRQELTFGTTGADTTMVPVLAKRNMVFTEHLHTSAQYSPLVRELTVVVDKDYKFKDIRSVTELKAEQTKGEVAIKEVKINGQDKLHNLVVRGTIPACTTDKDCAGSSGVVDPPLKCSVEQGYCSPPFARFNESCVRDVKECDPKGGPNGLALVCLRLTVREKFYCHHSCASRATDTDSDKDRDSRCGSILNFRCYGYKSSDPNRPDGLCVRTCNSRVSAKEDLYSQCQSATPNGHCNAKKPATCCEPNNPKVGQACCGNGKLEIGETCDDGNNKNGDGCNEFCTLSTYDRCSNNSDCKEAGQKCQPAAPGQANTYCLPAAKEKDEREDKDKYRTICMAYNWCWPPDERADWLGKKDEN